jgi:hypothetical protein
VQANVERPFGRRRLISHTTLAQVVSSVYPAPQELIYLGGPASDPGYDFHSLAARAAVGEHLEWQMPMPFPAFSLGRFGRVPGMGTFAPYIHTVTTVRPHCQHFADSASPPAVRGPDSLAPGDCGVAQTPSRTYPSIGAGFLTPFNLLRIDVARGLGPGGRWMFNIDVSREFWRIL